MAKRKRSKSHGLCRYHQCDKRTRLFTCKYCHDKFCKEHLRAKPPGMPRFKGTSTEDRIFMREWKNKYGHPCVPYYDYKENKRKQGTKDYLDALDRLKNKKQTSEKEYIHPQTQIKKNEKTKFNFKKKKVWPLIIILVLVVLLSYLYLGNQSSIVVNETVDVTETFLQSVEANISFADYMGAADRYSDKEMDLIGFLEHDIGEKGLHFYYVVDDFNNKLALKGLTNIEKNLFLRDEKTENLYNVNGRLAKDYRGTYFVVSDIEKGERPLKDIEVSQTVQSVVKKKISKSTITEIFDRVKYFISRKITCEDNTPGGTCSINKPLYCNALGNLNKDSEKCGCPEGKRSYKKDCVPIIECKDGTLHPECSKDKPYQCIEGNLFMKASVCGCPPDHKIVNNKCEKIERCADETIYGDCSKDKPKYCFQGNLVNQASKCGCSWGEVSEGEVCVSKQEKRAKEAFNYLNELRIQNGRKEIEWDERAYSLAIDRSKDMFERNYFDHVTPEGTCARDMQSDYGFSPTEVLAENAGGMTYYSGGTPVTGDVKEAIDGWMDSRGHRYNLLYSTHRGGAVGCYKHICVFFGVHKDPYGLGAGPCATGEEGLAYWNSVGMQPGEI